MVALELVHPSRAEPGRETMRIYSALGVLEYLVPKVHRASQPSLRFPPKWKCCGNHRQVQRLHLVWLVRLALTATRPCVVTTHESSRLSQRKIREAGFCLNETSVARENCIDNGRTLHK